MNKYTKGPWTFEVVPVGNYPCRIVGPNRRAIAETLTGIDNADRANAALLAAAPELFEALMQVYADLQRYAPTSKGSIEARAVIIKLAGVIS